MTRERSGYLGFQCADPSVLAAAFGLGRDEQPALIRHDIRVKTYAPGTASMLDRMAVHLF